MKLNKSLFKYINIALTVALIIFSYFYISSLLDKADFSSVNINILYALLSIILFATSYVFFALNWLISARIFRPNITKYQILVFFASQPYKYLPTSLFIFSSRAVFSKKLGLPIKQSSSAQLVENIILFTANISVFLIFYSFTVNNYLSLGLIFIIVVVFLLIKNKNTIQIKFKKNKFTINSIELGQAYLVSVTGWLITGLAFIAINKSLGLNIDFTNLMAANTIAFFLSMIAFFAPGGIGVREYVYKSFGVSTLAIIYWRIIVFFVDFLVGIPAIVAIKHFEKRLAKVI
jgi:uncharacterized membrane protein YbhN (UPF0104 family)